MADVRLAAIVDEVRLFLAAHADPTLAARYERYFTEGYDAYGIEPQVWEARLKEWTARFGAELGPDGCIDLGDELGASGKYEEGALAIRTVAQFRRRLDEAQFQRLGRWCETWVRNWAHADLLCGDILSPSMRDGQLRLVSLADWRASPAKFRRRAVPVAMLGLLKAEPEYDEMLGFLRPLMLDETRVVQQGLGWFLREAWKLNREPVEAFLSAWKDTAPRLIFQYATEKMNAVEKERFRRAKPAK